MDFLNLAEWAERLTGDRSDAAISEMRAFNEAVHQTQPGPKVNIPLDYGASLDAAMTLVPEGWQGDGMKWWAEEGASCHLIGSQWNGESWVHQFNDGRVQADAATPALALCAAALRAHHGR